MDPDPSIELGGVVIWLPTAGEPKCNIVQDLAGPFGLETNHDAMVRLRRAWREGAYRGRLDLDCESDFVSIYAGRDAIVDAAVLITRLAISGRLRAVSDQDVSRVRAEVSAYRRPPRRPWEVGDVFAVPLDDGSFAFGQVLWEDCREPTCALFEHRSVAPETDLDEALTSRTLAILHVSSEHLDAGEWQVVGRHPPMNDPFSGPCGRPGTVGCTSWDGLDTLANAWYGLTPWNVAYRDDYLEQFLMPAIERPAAAVMLGKDELLKLGVRRREWE